ncbi:MAG: tRNA-intron lyase [Candidatus Bathyarchaeota archaeon]|nr:MAG: tRNA-intron lyase [Candidatus Bathyarchaeota archaeon]
MSVELIEDFLVVWNTTEASKLYERGYFGKPLGIPKPKTTTFDAPLILDLIEGLYLLEEGIIDVEENLPSRRKVDTEKLRALAQEVYEDFNAKYAVYRDLRKNKYAVTPGIKYGCDFAVYKYGPGVEHAPYMVSVKKRGEDITATDIVKAGRLATTVRKRFIVASPSPKDEKDVKYLIFKWFKA